MSDQKISVTYAADTTAAVQAVAQLSGAMREGRDAADAAGKGQKGLARDVAATRAEQHAATEAQRKAAEAQQVHTLTVAAFGKASQAARDSEAKLTAATQEAQRAAAAAAVSVEKLAMAVTAAAKAEDGNLSPATKRAASQVEKMGKDAERTALELQKAELAGKKGGAGFDIMGMASGKLMSILGPAALAGSVMGLVGWLGEASAKTLQYETAVANLPFALTGAQEATHGLMSEAALAVTASQALSLKVVKTGDEFAQLASDAAKIALKLGTSTDKMLGDLTTALGRGSAMILDNAGIILKVSDANEAYAKSIGKDVSELDEMEKKTAFQIAAMKAIRESADATTVAYDSNAAAVARLKIGAGDAWDAMERGAVYATGATIKGIEAVLDSGAGFVREMNQIHLAAEATADAVSREMMRAEGWSQGFKDTAASAALAAVELGGFSNVLSHFQNVMNDPQRDEKIAANLELEREKADLMKQEAHFAELQAKALDKINKDMEAHLEAQAAASVVYGPAPPPKAEKKKRAAKPKKEMADPGDVARARIFDGRVLGDDVSNEAAWTQIGIEQEAAERSNAIKQEALALELEILDARGLAGEEGQAARESLQARQLAADEAFARRQLELAATDAQREKATTALAAVEHQKRLVALRKGHAEEAAAYAAKVKIVTTVTGRIESLGTTMVDAAWQAAEGQRGAGLQALGDYLKTVSKQMAVKALVETALGVSALAGVVTAGLAPGHFAAAGIAAGVAVAAGGAGVGLSMAGEARAGGGASKPEAVPDSGSAAGGSAAQGGGNNTPREMPVREAPVSYAPSTAGAAANSGPPITINFAGASFYGAGSPAKAAQEIEKLLSTNRAAGRR